MLESRLPVIAIPVIVSRCSDSGGDGDIADIDVRIHSAFWVSLFDGFSESQRKK